MLINLTICGFKLNSTFLRRNQSFFSANTEYSISIFGKDRAQPNIGRFYTREYIIHSEGDWKDSASSSVKPGTRRVSRLDEVYFVVRRSRRTSKYASSRQIMRFVPVFILEDAVSVQSNCPSSSIKTAITTAIV